MDSQSSNTSDEAGLQIKQLGDLVTQAFTNLKHKHESQRTTNREAALVNDQAVNSKGIHYDRLHSSLLPLLKEQLTTITTFLEPRALRREPEPRLGRVLELLPELDSRISQLDSAVRILCPERLFIENQRDDHDLKEFKRFRLIDLEESFHQLHRDICSFLNTASEHIQQMELSTVRLVVLDGPDDEVNDLQAASQQAFHSIDYMIKHFEGSELDVAEDRRAYAVADIDQLLKNTLSIVTPNAPKSSPSQRKLMCPRAIQLTLLIIPIIKLFKLFFKKLSKDGLNMNPKRLKLPKFRQMNSIQLDSLSRSAGMIHGGLSSLVHLLTQADPATLEGPCSAPRYLFFAGVVERLPPNFEPALLSVVLHLIPLIDDPSDQN
ncbi:hypothetical protein PGT21_026319 [Puccinia graminis f. sp. tritici]|uniref:Uncharacterized protein n=2 Tax=Puccinia graminis f. sp. tritici TaxID=56615 RepID=E3JSI7_PUCGT|nr:uncharacterized protein PGTG_01553 [Puccinia graminis f. sp. tritici CRL 75-36-700-3]EFP74960.1 hypothetical protein PGTG_01553 [Puccinia graminis f. sp. tritici CRL 75-36-700-3]KAA1117882.1 hypothetical protein PGT21_026319 [Puccinia graminis f. sp. tritici]